MKFGVSLFWAVAFCFSVPTAAWCQRVQENALEEALAKFTQCTGAEIVFSRDDLPPGKYHDILKPLVDAQKLSAIETCIEESRLYPPRFFEKVGLKKIGVFAVCASKTTTDQHREYDKELGGYRYYGVYNGTDAIAASFYSEGQLSLTLHHEIFHHVDSTVDGVTEKWQLSGDDAFYQAAISGVRPYKAPSIPLADLKRLRSKRIGTVLKDVVSEYAAKNSREDQAETARHMLSMLASSLVQTVDQPELPGSQRILHVLKEYERAVPDGPGIEWFVDVALKRADHRLESRSVDQLLADMRKFGSFGEQDVDGARRALKAAVGLDAKVVTTDQANEIVTLSAKITSRLLRERLRPDPAEERFNVWGNEDSKGINHTLRRDVLRFASDAKRLALIGEIHTPGAKTQANLIAAALLRDLRLIARYYVFINSRWSVTAGTKDVFDSAKETILKSLPPESGVDASSFRSQSLEKIAAKSKV